jgi:hypothetical protein
MLKIRSSLLLILFSFNGFAQKTEIAIPMKNGKVYYEKNSHLNNSLLQEELFNRVLEWFKHDLLSTEKIKLSDDKKTGEIFGSGIFKIVTSGTGNYYLVRFAISIKVFNDGYTFTANNFYEKPHESGISNEYSKIEYRWWDYRQAKPWSAEDEILFKGIASDETALMASLEDEMK